MTHFYGAGDEGRTRDIQLGRLTLYQLSYSRILFHLYYLVVLVAGAGFEPSKAEPSDLQSDPFGRSGTSPLVPRRGIEPLFIE